MRVQVLCSSLLLTYAAGLGQAQQTFTSLDAQMKAINAEREAKSKASNAVHYQIYIGSLGKDISLRELSALKIAYDASRICSNKRNKAEAYSQIRHLLTSRDPALVGLGCQIAAYSGSLDLISDLGQLIDRTDTGTIVEPITFSQMPTPVADRKYYFIVPTVGKLAQYALLSITNIQFADRSEFEKWFKDWDNRKQRVWYWKAKWQRLEGGKFRELAYKKLIPRLPVLGNKDGLIGMWSNETKKSYYGKPKFKAPIVRQPFYMFDSEFKNLDKATVLNILIQQNNEKASQNEAQWIVGNQPKDVDSSLFNSESGLNSVYMDSNSLAEFVRANALQSQLLGFLDRANDTKPSALTGIDQRQQVLRAAEQCIDEKFSSEIGRIASTWTDSPQIWQSMIVLQSRIDPSRALTILDAGLSRSPSNPAFLAELVGRAPASRSSEFVKSYTKLPEHEASSFLLYLSGVSTKGNKIPIAFIRGLLELPGEPLQVFPDRKLAYLAECLNKTLGRQAVSQSIIDVARYGRMIGKGGGMRSTGFEEAANAKLKEAMLAALASEKTY